MLRFMKHTIALFLFTLSSALAEPDQYHRLALEGIALGHNMQIDEAEEIFNEMIALDPEHPLGHLALAVMNLYKYWLEENPQTSAQKFKAYADKAIKLSKQNLSSRPRLAEAWFCLGAANLYLGVYHGDRENWLRAFWHGKQGIDYFKKAVEIDPNYYDAYWGLGLCRYYAEARRSFILKTMSSLFLGIEGDRKKGLNELQLVAEKGVLARAQALFFLGFIYSSEQEYEKALTCFQELTALYPDNPFPRQFHILMLQNTGDYSQSLAMATRIAQEKSANRNPKFDISLYRILGNLYFDLNQFEAAKTHYHQALEIASRSHGQAKWVARANFQLGHSCEMLGQRQEANAYYQRVKKSDDKYLYERAQEFIKQPLLPVDIDLIRGRNYSQTKNYEQALAVFEEARAKANENTKDYSERKIPEIQYHIAKTQYDKKAFADAIVEFKFFFATKKIEEKWIEPWAHFYLGDCYREMGEMQKAEAEFGIAYKYDNGALRFEIKKVREKYGF